MWIETKLPVKKGGASISERRGGSPEGAAIDAVPHDADLDLMRLEVLTEHALRNHCRTISRTI